MTVVLRDYQETMVNEARMALRDHRIIVLQSPTGAGKTTTAAAVIEKAVQKGSRVVFAAHLDALIGDTQARLARCGIWAGRVQSGEKSSPLSMVQVCSLQTLHARGAAPPADLVFIDECHRALAPSVRGILGCYPKSKIIGLTATPIRSDKQALGDVFEHMVLGPSISDLIAKKVLCPVRSIFPETFARSMAEDPVMATREHGGNAITVFSKSVAASVKFVEDWNNSAKTAGEGEAVHIDGLMENEVRREILADFAAGKFRVLSNCQLLSEGWDCPRVDTIVFAQIPGHRGSYMQRIGRGMRPFEGKSELRVLDLCGVTNLHGLVTERIDWTLETSTNGVRVKGLPAPKSCVECCTMNDPGEWFCVGCGAEIPRVIKNAHLPVEVRELKSRQKANVPNEERMREDFEAWKATGIARGYSPKWANVQFSLRYGMWPEGRFK